MNMDNPFLTFEELAPATVYSTSEKMCNISTQLI